MINTRARLISGGLASLAVAMLAACTATKHSAAPSPQQTQLQSHMTALKNQQLLVAQKNNELAQLHIDHRAVVRRVKEDQKQIPLILGQSDDALRQAQQYKNISQKNKTEKEKTVATNSIKIKSAQKLADEKAALLVATRRDLYASFDQAASLQKRIKTISAQKETAERGAKLEAMAIEQLKQPNHTKLAGTAQNSETDGSRRSGRIAGNGSNTNH